MIVRAAPFLLLLCGCRQLLGFENPTVTGDAALDPDVLVIPDAGPCQAIGATCEAGVVLRECLAIGEQPIDTTCAWGCLDNDGAHCGALVPGGGAVLDTDLSPAAALSEITIQLPSTVLDTDTGSITNLRAAGQGVSSGIEYATRNNVGVFRVKTLNVDGLLLIRGSRSAVIIATEGAIVISNVIDARGTCIGNDAGPGGSRGGNSGSDGQGPGAGKRGQAAGSDASGGGGGGHGADGSRGGLGGATQGGPLGASYGNAEITILRGGSGGGSGGRAGDGGPGGGGGGAIQLISNTRIAIVAGGGINAGGCGGDHASDATGGGGGGGSGGAILLEAPIVVLDGGLAVNGGGGGGGRSGMRGADGLLSVTRAAGGTAIAAGDGGAGGAVGALSGDQGGDDNSCGGGGGGAVGRIRIHTVSGTAQIGATGFTSPTLIEPGTSTTQAPAMVH